MRVLKKLLLSLLVSVVTISSVCVLGKQEAVVQTVNADNYYNINLTPKQIDNILTKLAEDAEISAFDVTGGIFKVADIVGKVLTAVGVFEDPEALKYQNLLNKLDGIYSAIKNLDGKVDDLTRNINTQLAKVIGTTEQVSTQVYVNGITNFESNYETPLQSAIDTLKTEVMNRVHNWYDNNKYTFDQYLYNDSFRINTNYIDYANGAPGVRKEIVFETNGDSLNTYRIEQERAHNWTDVSKAEEYIKPIFENLFDNYIENTRNNDGFYNWLKVVNVGETNPFVGFNPITQRRNMIDRYNELSDKQKAELKDKFAAAGYESLRKEALNRYSRDDGFMSILLSTFKAYCDRLSESSSISGEFKNSPLRDHYNIYQTIYGFQGDLNFTIKAKVYDENGKETGETKDVSSNLAEAARVKYITNLVKFGTFVTIMAKESKDVSNDDLNTLVYEPWAAAENRINQIYNGFYKIFSNGGAMDDWCYITNSVLRYDNATISSHSELLHQRSYDMSYRQDHYSFYEDRQKYEDWKCSVDNSQILDDVGVKRLYARAQAIYGNGGNVNFTSYLNKNLNGYNLIPTPDSKGSNDTGYQATYIMTHFTGGKDFNLNDHVEMRVHTLGQGDWFIPYDGPYNAFATNTDPNGKITETYYKKHDAAYGQFTSLIDASLDPDVSIARRAVFARTGFLWNREEFAFMWDAIVDTKHVFSDRKYDETWIHQGKQYLDKTKSCSEYCSSTSTHYNPTYSNPRYEEDVEYITEYMDISRQVGILRIDRNTKPVTPPTPSLNAVNLNSSYPNVDNNDDGSLVQYESKTNEYGQVLLLGNGEPLPKLVSELTIKNIAMKELDGKEFNDIEYVEGIYDSYLEKLYKNYSYNKESPYLPYAVYLDNNRNDCAVLEDAKEYLYEKDEGMALYDNLIKMSLDYNKIADDIKNVSYEPINIGKNTLKSLIAKANEDNNKPEKLVSAVFDTVVQRDNETLKGVQEGVTCYVSSKNKYYKYEDGSWSEMSDPTISISNDAILEYETECFVGFEILINENGDIDYEVQPVYDIHYCLKDANGKAYRIDSSLLKEVGIDKVNIRIPVFNANGVDNHADVEIYDDKNYFVEPVLTSGFINKDNYLELEVDSKGYPLYVSNTYIMCVDDYKPVIDENYSGTLEFVINADFDDASDVVVKIDGTIVDPSNYDLSHGSTHVNLHNDYIKTLSLAEHTITISVKGVDEDQKFVIIAASTPKPGYRAPKTGVE